MKLEDVCEIEMGQSPDSSSYNEIGLGLPFFQGNADFGDVCPRARMWCTSPKKIAKPADILLSVRAPVGALNIAAEECCIGRGLAAIRPKKTKISRDYLMICLHANKGFFDLMSTGSTFKAINKKVLMSCDIPLRPLSEQEAIASQFRCVMRQENDVRQIEAQLNELVKSEFVELFGDPMHNEKGYPEKRLGELLEIARGGSPRPIKDYLTNDPEGINWIKIGDTAEGSRYINSTAEKIRPEGKAKSREVKAGDFLLSNSMSFGRPYILNIDGCIHDGWLVLSDNEKRFNKIFLYELLGSSALKAKFAASVRGGVVNNLNIDLVASTVVPYPPLALQQQFADFVAEVDKLVFDVRWQIEELEHWRHSIHAFPHF